MEKMEEMFMEAIAENKEETRYESIEQRDIPEDTHILKLYTFKI
ncbi:MAG: hypothetical protein ACLS9A_06570 [Clostridia bacterium]